MTLLVLLRIRNAPHLRRRVARGGCPPPALTEPYLCFSHTALRDDGLLPPPPAGSQPLLSQKIRGARLLRGGHGRLGS